MSFLAQNGRISIDDGGIIRLDTDEGLFHTINVASGSYAVPQITVTTGNIDWLDSWLIGTCHADCTDVIGAVKFTLNNYAAGMAFDRWHTIMGGSIMWLMDGENGQQSNVGWNTVPIRQFVTYTFRVASGNIYLDRRAALNAMPTGGTYSVLSHTIHWRLEVGLFT